MPTFTLPHLIYGTITNGDFLKIIIRNETNGEEQQTITNSKGRYIVDGGNFTSGWSDGDEIKLIIGELPQHTENITTDNGDLRLTD